MTLSLVELAEDIRFAGIAGELLTEMGFKIRRHFRSGTTLARGIDDTILAAFRNLESTMG